MVSTGGPRHAHHEGFDLHANVAARAGERRRLEHLCRYVLLPPVPQDVREVTPEGRVLLRLRRPWRDGTRAIRFEPSELLERLAALVPRPRANLLLYHGAFAARGCWRVARATAPGADRSPAPEAEAPAAVAASPPSPPSSLAPWPYRCAPAAARFAPQGPLAPLPAPRATGCDPNRWSGGSRGGTSDTGHHVNPPAHTAYAPPALCAMTSARTPPEACRERS